MLEPSGNKQIAERSQRLLCKVNPVLKHLIKNPIKNNCFSFDVNPTVFTVLLFENGQ